MNGEKVPQSEAEGDTYCYKPNIYFTSAKISRRSTFWLEVWDKDGFIRGEDDLIVSVGETIDSFLGFRYREFIIADGNPMSHIETVSYWEDEKNK